MQDIEPAEGVRGQVDHRVHLVLDAQVDLAGHGSAAGGNDLVGDLLGPGGVDIRNHDAGAQFGEELRGRRTDPARRAGYHRDLARQVNHVSRPQNQK